MSRTLLVFFFFLRFFVYGQDQNISEGAVFDGEPNLAMNPSNSNHLVVAWMGFKFGERIVINVKTSFDGGTTWSEEVEIPHSDPIYSSADPSLYFDSEGNLFLCYIDFDKFTDVGGIYVRKSTDGGLSWGEEALVMEMDDDPEKRAIDRPWMVIDQSDGAYANRIYVTSMNAASLGPVPPPYNPYLNTSADGGASFSDWSYIDAEDWETGSLLPSPMPSPTLDSDGILHVAYPAWVLSHDLLPRYILASSSDGGSTFSYNDILYVDSGEGVNDSLAKAAHILRCDPSDPDHLVFVRIGQNFGDLDVLMSTSFDGGETWSDEMRVNDDPIGNDRMQDLIWADFDTDGDLVVAWRDRRNAESEGYDAASEIWGAVLRTDSMSFSNNFPISNVLVAYDTILASSGNDFMSVQIENDTIHAVWGDTDDGSLDVWYNRVGIDGEILSVQKIVGDPVISIYPNPTTGVVTVSGLQVTAYQLCDLSGQVILAKEGLLEDEVTIGFPEGTPSGTYLLYLMTEKGRMTRKILVK